MSKKNILIQNVYRMMAYAFRTVQRPESASIETEQFEHLHDLFAEIISRGMAGQIKRGLHHDYRVRSESLNTVRGQIEVSRTATTRGSAPGRIVCSFDEYLPDTAMNRAVKSAIVLLIRHGEVSKTRRDTLRRVLAYLESIKLVSPRSIRWGDFQFNRSNGSYRILLGACELVVRGLLPTEESGENKLANWLSDDVMSTLYENFLREYYAFHHPELSPRAKLIEWDTTAENSIGLEQLPAMRTDITLQAGKNVLIIDAKYYGHSMQQSRWGKSTIHSANLYQIFTYVKNTDRDADGLVSGLLLYAKTEGESHPDLDAEIQGDRIGAHSLDLNTSWDEIVAQLEGILTWLPAPQRALL
ncbi:5-methylcytosine-specific restriction endonuclease system specificity protein McrC [Corynebacterium lubricantis]|uniref:5-methylcytosine-specific restriction endonuclease system specificity protein McrC n=1 Tax=Corynebacterium lubricantis TaxID=541095 RepID=UPI00037ABC62|nr:5-methylcytosine-specific restriction endonuclease system specificity protein McrC [Corynebacterium lubricantis]